MVPLLKFYFHEDVRRAAVQALPHLVASAQQAAEAGTPGADAAFVKGMVDFFWEPLMAAIHKEPDTDVQAKCGRGAGRWAQIEGGEAQGGHQSQPPGEGGM
jgi:hypothetical protein